MLCQSATQGGRAPNVFFMFLKNIGYANSWSTGGSVQSRSSTDPAALLRKGELGLFDNLQLGPASLASEAPMMPGTRIHRASRWTEDDDNLLRTLAEAGKSLTILGVQLNRPMTAVKTRAQDLGIRIAGTQIGQ